LGQAGDKIQLAAYSYSVFIDISGILPVFYLQYQVPDLNSFNWGQKVLPFQE